MSGRHRGSRSWLDDTLGSSRRSGDGSDRQSSGTEEHENGHRMTVETYKYGNKDAKAQDPSLSQATMSATGQTSHVPDQFPDQIPMEHVLPYRPHPPSTPSYGEAASYYGNQGQFAAHQTGDVAHLNAGVQPYLSPAYDRPNLAQGTGSGSAAAYYNGSYAQANTRFDMTEGPEDDAPQHLSSPPHTQRPRSARRSSPRRKGALNKLAEWWNDYEDVRRMEEYTEYIGVCRYCFDPDSRPGDKPRKHYHRRKSHRGHQNRVDKDDRYISSSSDSESLQRRSSARRRHSLRLERQERHRKSDILYEVNRSVNRATMNVEDGTSTHRKDEDDHETMEAPNRRDNEVSFLSGLLPRFSSTRRRNINKDDDELETEDPQTSKRMPYADNQKSFAATASEALIGLGAAATALAAASERFGIGFPRDHISKFGRTNFSRQRSANDHSSRSASKKSSTSSFESGLVYGDYDEDRSSMRSSSSSTDSEAGQRSHQQTERREAPRYEGSQAVRGHTEQSSSQSQSRYSQAVPDSGEGWTQPLQLLDPRPLDRSPQRLHGEERGVSVYDHQPSSPPRRFAKFEGDSGRIPSEPSTRDRSPTCLSQVAPVQYGTSRQSLADDSARATTDTEASRALDIEDQSQLFRIPIQGRSKDFEPGSEAGMWRNTQSYINTNNSERKRSVRFAGIAPEVDEPSTAQHHSRRDSQESHSVFPTIDSQKTDIGTSMRMLPKVVTSDADLAVSPTAPRCEDEQENRPAALRHSFAQDLQVEQADQSRHGHEPEESMQEHQAGVAQQQDAFDEDIEKNTPGGFVEDQDATREQPLSSKSDFGLRNEVSVESTRQEEEAEVQQPRADDAGDENLQPSEVDNRSIVDDTLAPSIPLPLSSVMESNVQTIDKCPAEDDLPFDHESVHLTSELQSRKSPSEIANRPEGRDDNRRRSANLAFLQHAHAIPELIALPTSRPGSPYDESPQTPEQSPYVITVLDRTRNSQPTTPSSTSIPLRFLRHSHGPGLSRHVPITSTPSPVDTFSLVSDSPVRARAPRPLSGDFKVNHEFRPLYLVERNHKPVVVEQDENFDSLPSLPSSVLGSMVGSQTSSIGNVKDDGFGFACQSSVGLDLDERTHVAKEPKHQGYFEMPGQKRVDDDEMHFLGSQQATPMATAVNREGGIDDVPELNISGDDTVARHNRSTVVNGELFISSPEETPFVTPFEDSTALSTSDPHPKVEDDLVLLAQPHFDSTKEPARMTQQEPWTEPARSRSKKAGQKVKKLAIRPPPLERYEALKPAGCRDATTQLNFNPSVSRTPQADDASTPGEHNKRLSKKDKRRAKKEARSTRVGQARDVAEEILLIAAVTAASEDALKQKLEPENVPLPEGDDHDLSNELKSESQSLGKGDDLYPEDIPLPDVDDNELAGDVRPEHVPLPYVDDDELEGDTPAHMLSSDVDAEDIHLLDAPNDEPLEELEPAAIPLSDSDEEIVLALSHPTEVPTPKIRSLNVTPRETTLRQLDDDEMAQSQGLSAANLMQHPAGYELVAVCGSNDEEATHLVEEPDINVTLPDALASLHIDHDLVAVPKSGENEVLDLKEGSVLAENNTSDVADIVYPVDELRVDLALQTEPQLFPKNDKMQPQDDWAYSRQSKKKNKSRKVKSAVTKAVDAKTPEPEPSQETPASLHEERTTSPKKSKKGKKAKMSSSNYKFPDTSTSSTDTMIEQLLLSSLAHPMIMNDVEEEEWTNTTRRRKEGKISNTLIAEPSATMTSMIEPALIPLPGPSEDEDSTLADDEHAHASDPVLPNQPMHLNDDISERRLEVGMILALDNPDQPNSSLSVARDLVHDETPATLVTSLSDGELIGNNGDVDFGRVIDAGQEAHPQPVLGQGSSLTADKDKLEVREDNLTNEAQTFDINGQDQESEHNHTLPSASAHARLPLSSEQDVNRLPFSADMAYAHDRTIDAPVPHTYKALDLQDEPSNATRMPEQPNSTQPDNDNDIVISTSSRKKKKKKRPVEREIYWWTATEPAEQQAAHRTSIEPAEDTAESSTDVRTIENLAKDVGPIDKNDQVFADRITENDIAERQEATTVQHIVDLDYIAEDKNMNCEPSFPDEEMGGLRVHNQAENPRLLSPNTFHEHGDLKEDEAVDMVMSAKADAETIESLLAATLATQGFDPVLASTNADDARNERVIYDALESDEEEVVRMTKSVRRRSRSGDNVQGRFTNAQARSPDGRDPAEVPELSFDDIISSSLLAAGFAEKQLHVMDNVAGEEATSEVDAGSPLQTGPSHLWQSGSKQSFLEADKDEWARSDSTTNSAERKTTGREGTVAVATIAHDKATDIISEREKLELGMAGVELRGIEEASADEPSQAVQGLADSLPSSEQQSPVTGHNARSLELSRDSSGSPQFRTAVKEEVDEPSEKLKEEQARARSDQEGFLYSASETLRHVFTSPETPRESFVATMRNSSTDESRPLYVTKRRLPSSSSPEIAGIRREYSSSTTSQMPSPSYARKGSSRSASLASSGSHSATPVLRRTNKRLSGDLRTLSQQGEQSALGTTMSDVDARNRHETSEYDPLRGNGNSRLSEVSHQQEEWRDARTSPTASRSLYRKRSKRSPDPEPAALMAEQPPLSQASRELRVISEASQLQPLDLLLQAKDVEIAQLKAKHSVLQQAAAELRDHNDQLQAANHRLTEEMNERISTLQSENAELSEQYQHAVSELAFLRQANSRFDPTLEDINTERITLALTDKELELDSLHTELNKSRSQVYSLQQHLHASHNRNKEPYLYHLTEDHFETAFHALFTHIHHFILRFSKHSDTRSCTLSSSLSSERLLTRLDNALLDGTDIDVYLSDRVKRRDIFTNLLVSILWDYVFSRYLFGLELAQRQRLKALEKTLRTVGPASAVATWRAITLTLLSRLPSFAEQRDRDVEAVVQEVFGMLCALVPPPQQFIGQLTDSLRRVVSAAAGLSVQMRTQRAEYIMLPPLSPEYDKNGVVVRKVRFNANLMSECRKGERKRGGVMDVAVNEDEEEMMNEEYEERDAIVRMVLFPLVLKRGDKWGEGEEEVVVFPAQVVVNTGRSGGGE